MIDIDGSGSYDIYLDICILKQIDDYEILKNCERVCWIWDMIIKNFEGYEVAKENYFAVKLMPELKLFPKGLIEVLGGKKQVYLLPVLTLDYSKVTDEGNYIDWLKPADLVGHSIWRGLDKFNRPFITFSYNQFGIYPFVSGTAVQTIHKRKTKDNLNRWMDSGNKTRDFHFPSSPGNEMNEVLSRLYYLFSWGIELHGLKITTLGAFQFLPLEYDIYKYVNSLKVAKKI
jgi:hypothetical protein